MGALNFNDFQGIVDAVQLKNALIDADHRFAPMPASNHRTAAEMLGMLKTSSMIMPIYEHTGDLFAQKQLNKPGSALTVSGTITENTIIEYENSNQQAVFGMVIEPPFGAKKDGVYLRTLTNEQAKQIMLNNPHLKRVKLTDKEVKPLKTINTPVSKLPVFLGFLGPVEKIFWSSMKRYAFLKENKKLFFDFSIWIYLLLIIVALVYVMWLVILK